MKLLLALAPCICFAAAGALAFQYGPQSEGWGLFLFAGCVVAFFNS